MPKMKLAKRSKHVYIKEIKNRSEAKVVNIKLWIWRSETNVVIAKKQISEAMRTGLF